MTSHSETIAHELLGTCKSEMEVADQNDVSVDYVLDCANQHDVERCEVCSWWVESCEIHEDGACKDCTETDE